MNHAESKARYLAYREVAQRLWPNDSSVSVRIPDQATVQMVDGGAFVEATVWVSDEQLTTYVQAASDHKAALEVVNELIAWWKPQES